MFGAIDHFPTVASKTGPNEGFDPRRWVGSTKIVSGKRFVIGSDDAVDNLVPDSKERK